MRLERVEEEAESTAEGQSHKALKRIAIPWSSLHSLRAVRHPDPSAGPSSPLDRRGGPTRWGYSCLLSCH